MQKPDMICNFHPWQSTSADNILLQYNKLDL